MKKLKPKNKDNTTTRINNCEVLVKLMEANLLNKECLGA